MKHRARGSFEIQLKALTEPDYADGVTFGRLKFNKQFSGDMRGISRGEMLSANTGTKGSAGYVAIERLEVTLQGRVGKFVMQHTASTNAGVQQMRISVVPDSATGELRGLEGTLVIGIVDGQHYYEFDYTLAPALVC